MPAPRFRLRCPFFLPLLAAMLALAACGPNLDEVAKKHKAPIEAKLALFPGIKQQLLTLPALDRDSLRIEGPVPVLSIDDYYKNVGNSSLSYAEDFADPLELGYVWGRIAYSGLFNHCASILHRGHAVFDPAQPSSYLVRPSGSTADSTFQRCNSQKYLFVVRSSLFLAPTSPDQAYCDADSGGPLDAALGDSSSDSAPPAKERRYCFDSGLIRAEVLAFEIPSTKYLGGFRIEAKSGEKVSGQSVDEDLRSRFRALVLDTLKKSTPGASVIE